MKSSEIREKFLRYFEKNSHTRVPSAPLIPLGDPTLYFVNAGMVPFKNVFIGQEKRPYTRAVSSQKCLRVSGKHNDLENVGRTARHHTFFEMLGNFSFGDYFKKEACRFGWEFLTKEMGLAKEKLMITIYTDDDEAEEIWHKEIGVPKERIRRFGQKENFWAMGESGPCGPCSEIHYDHGEKQGCGKKSCTVNCECDRYMEIWNLVFMQFNRDDKGKLTPLPKPSIDTGMGLERLACVAQGKHSNYESDLFTPLIKECERLTGKKYGKGASPKGDTETDISIQVLCDHIRSATFLIADGVQPSNEGRGYVLRRILRRAIRHGKLLGQTKPFFYKLAEVVVREMGQAYPEIREHRETIEKVIEGEEERFLETLDRGLSMIEEELAKIKKSGEKKLAGSVVFKLYDTYGFPRDLTELIAEEKGFSIDRDGFESEMAKQKKRGKQAWKGSGEKGSGTVYQVLLQKERRSRFVGYDRLQSHSPVMALVCGETILSKVASGEEVEVVTEETPFYPEGGGQVGDKGLITTKKVQLQVVDTRKPVEGIIVHKAEVVEGTLQEGDEVDLAVDAPLREATMAHHSATHLLHAALRLILGKHVRQGGSLVTPNRLRFDFSHFEAVDRKKLQEIENLVNEKIRADLAVTHELLAYKKAIEKGALAFFGDKYGDIVRTCRMGDFSMELCGGTHVRATGQIGLLKILSESSVSAGTRRIEAVVGGEALAYLRQLELNLHQAGQLLKSSPAEVASRIERLIEQVKNLEKEIQKQKVQALSSQQSSNERVEEIKGVKLLTVQTETSDGKLLRDLSDKAIGKLGSGIALLVGSGEGKGDSPKTSLIVRVSKDLTSKYDAGKIVKELAPLIGGSGGGRPDMAQAGGTDSSHLDQVFQKVKTIL
ncbi:MAG: alanine--tRNA ligase [Deltaproteobacteria bacterium]|nr:alanine--tRNA ligase [Deltaproteobacteria bacterium]